MIEIQPVQKAVNATVAVPGSKSYTNRALLVAALAEGRSRLTGALFSDDTHYMCEALRKLGVEIEADAEGCTFEVVGNGGKIPVDYAELYIGNAGTAARPLVSYVALGNGEFIIDGDAPMRQSRPISDLLDALKQLDVDVRSKFNNNFLPLIVQANGLKGGKTRLDSSKSSQFLTSLMLVAPYAEKGIAIEVVGEMKTPYIDITTSVMKAFGVDVTHDNYKSFYIKGGQHYQSREYAVEPDASNASYFFAAAAVTGGHIRVTNLSTDSAQGDVQFVNVLERMGCQVKTLRRCYRSHRTKSAQRDRSGYEGDLRHIVDPRGDRSFCRGSRGNSEYRAYAPPRNGSYPRNGHRTSQTWCPRR